jgi:dGTPase
LNLTFEVREGIIKHSRDYSAPEFPELAEYHLHLRPPLEAQLIDWVDGIAYNAADLDDGVESRLLDLDLLLAELPFFAHIYREINSSHPHGRSALKIIEALKRMLDHFATDLIEHTRAQVAASGAQSAEEIFAAARRLAGLSPAMAAEHAALKKFLSERLYDHPAIVEERERSVAALSRLFAHYLEVPSDLPPQYALQAETEPRHRVVCDYIAGMTDHYLLKQHHELLGERLMGESTVESPRRYSESR